MLPVEWDIQREGSMRQVHRAEKSGLKERGESLTQVDTKDRNKGDSPGTDCRGPKNTHVY